MKMMPEDRKIGSGVNMLYTAAGAPQHIEGFLLPRQPRLA
ncbi:hypothetical protein ING2E5B_1704 [Fermentimonas caenicola]|uniref:Uncharacterized protein n=1 Tax=Fermentimonas caenicola TaxID=1562970 RepID=A0A098C0P4_9BACT|nr:hypothetical protein ING2E5B_1704 [Fermentimonas caenicola]